MTLRTTRVVRAAASVDGMLERRILGVRRERQWFRLVFTGV
jgi:hypothetical protein